MKSYLFDAFPILCWLQEEPGHKQVENLLLEAENGSISLHMNLINLGEVFYRICKIASAKKAEEIVSKIKLLPISFISILDEMVMEAARVKGKYPVSYTDAFTIASAIRLKSAIVTADPEYRAVSKLVEIVWIK